MEIPVDECEKEAFPSGDASWNALMPVMKCPVASP